MDRLDCSGPLLTIWNVLDHSGLFWAIWNILDRLAVLDLSGLLWTVLTILDFFGPFGPFWTIFVILDCFGPFLLFLTIPDHKSYSKCCCMDSFLFMYFSCPQTKRAELKFDYKMARLVVASEQRVLIE